MRSPVKARQRRPQRLSDGDEVNVYGTGPHVADSDADTISDRHEVEALTDPLDPFSRGSWPASKPFGGD